MDPIENKIADVFASFEREDDPDLLYSALNDVEDVHRNAQPQDSDACKRGLLLLIKFLAAVDQHIDPKWDAANVPIRRVPPPGPEPPSSLTGEVDPETITDPVIRARYEQQLNTNRDKVKRYHAQFNLRRIEERAVDDLKLFAEACFTGSPTDRREFEELLNSSSLSDVRRKKFRKLVTPGLWPFK